MKAVSGKFWKTITTVLVISVIALTVVYITGRQADESNEQAIASVDQGQTEDSAHIQAASGSESMGDELQSASASVQRADADPRYLAGGMSALTGPSGREPLDIAKNYLKSQQSDMGLKEEQIDDVVVTDQYVSKHNGVTHLYLRQQYDGIEVINGNLNMNIDKDGRVLNMGSSFVPHLEDVINARNPELTQLEAVDAVATLLGVTVDESFGVVEDHNGPSQEVLVSAAGLSSAHIPVRLEYYAESKEKVTLVWSLKIDTADSCHYWDMKIDALTGALVNKDDWVVHENYNCYAMPLIDPADGGRTIEVNPYLDSPSSASPFGWHDTNGVAGAEYTITRGNNVHAYEDSSNTGASLGNEPDGGAGLNFDFPINLSVHPSNYVDASTVNLFYWNNICHDIHYEYGFDEVSGNFQINNYGNGGLGNDDVHAECQDGGGFNNANMLTLADGSSPRMQMYLGNNVTPYRDGSLDNLVVIHEFGHGVSKRLTGGPSNVSVLNSNQSGGMGEGWSDWWGLALTAKASDSNTQARAVGTWLFGQAPDGPGIRLYPYSTDMGVNPHTYGDIDSVTIPHGIGTVWCTALWDMYWNLVDAHGFDPDFYNGTGGNNIAMQLVMDGLKLQPSNPTFLDARDAILMADSINNGGANQMLIWQAFAKRGMGFSAYDGGSESALIVTEAFDLPDDLRIVQADDFTAAGDQGGPFTPSSKIFDVWNAGASPVTWTASKTAAWLDLSSSGGTLAVGASNTVTVSFNATANSLVPGTYTDTVTFSNTASGVSQARDVELVIYDYATVPFTDGFESGSFDAHWRISGTSSYRTQVTSLNTPQSGTYHATLDSTTDGSYARNELTLAMDLSGQVNLVLRFWAKDFGDEENGPPSTPFIGGADFDGVAISQDGNTWYEVQPLRSEITGVYSEFIVDLDAAIGTHGLSYDSDFFIRFNQYDNFTIATDGIAIDDVTVTSEIPQPKEDIVTFPLDSDPGWATEGQWEFGAPLGAGGDPASAYSGANVYGYNLAGQYSNNIPQHWLTTTAIDCSGYENVELTFQRWLGVESSSFDHAEIEVSNDGSTWVSVWSHTGGSFTDPAWTEFTYDISSVADTQSTVYVRWGMGTTDGSVTYCGWNIDDVVIAGNEIVNGGVNNGKALYFGQSVDFSHGETALLNLGFDTTSVSDFTPFQTSLNTGSWEVVVVEVYGNAFSDAVATDVANFISGGGHILFYYWDMDGSSTASSAAILRSAFGASTTTDFFTPMPVYPWDTGHAIFNSPNSVGTLTVAGDNGGNDNGDRVEPAAGATALGGFTVAQTTGEGAIVVANDGRTLLNAFGPDDMNDIVPLLENEIAFLSGGSGKVLLVSDTLELAGVEPFLIADGHDVTSISNEWANGSANLTNLTFLQQFEMVIWGAQGSGAGAIHPSAVHSTLETYIQNGGNLLVTGYDTLASPTDTAMAALVRSTGYSDATGQSSFTTASTDHFILNGPYGDFRNTVITPGYSDWDGSVANAASGTISLATFSVYDAIIYTDISGGGSVGYWTGGDGGALSTDGKDDWKTPGDSLDILRNWVAGVVGAGVSVPQSDIAVELNAPSSIYQWQEFQFMMSVDNNGPDDAENVMLTNTVPAGVAVLDVDSAHGWSWSMIGSEVIFDIGTLSAGSYSAWLDVVAVNTGLVNDAVSAQGSTVDPVASNNSTNAPTTVLAGVDSDGDGIMDWWEILHTGGLGVMNQTSDTDGNGQTDLEAWIAMTHPTNGTLFAVGATTNDSGQFVVTWDSWPGREYDIYWTSNLMYSFQLLEQDLVFPQNSYTDTVNTAEGFYNIEVHMEGEHPVYTNKNVGYYDMSAAQGVASQTNSITASGNIPVLVNDLTAGELAGVDVLYVQNPDNGVYGAEYLAQLGDIQSAVAAGMVLIIHDRHVTGAASILPGGGGITFVRSPNADVDVVDASTLVTSGPGGVVDNTTLDGGDSSTHGYATLASLPGSSVAVLSQTDPTYIVTFAYPYGSGWVIYSTIPLDYYLAGAGSVPAFANIYAPNVVAYGALLAP
jgi:extracellular elastinolytic metalloproteinase